MGDAEKRCTACKATKAMVDFPTRTASRDGKASECKPCTAARKAEYQRRNREKVNASHRRYRRQNREKVNAKARERMRWWRRDNLDKTREKNWRNRGLDLSYPDFLAAYDAQGGCCAICDTRLELSVENGSQGKVAFADHDHETGKFRGVLCYGCNRRVIGFIERDPVLITKALRYLGIG